MKAKLVLGIVRIGFGKNAVVGLSIASSIVVSSSVLSTAIPLVFGKLVGGLASGATSYSTLVAVYSLAILAGGIFNEARQLVLGLLDNNSFFRLSVETYSRALLTRYEHHLEEESGVTYDRLNLGAEAGSTLLQYGLGTLLPYALQVALSASVLLYLFGWMMACVVVGCVLSFAAITIYATSHLKKIQREIVQSQSVGIASIFSGLEAVETVKALNVEAGIVALLSSKLSDYHRNVKSYLGTKFVTGSASQIVVASSLAAALLLLNIIGNGQPDAETVVVVSLYLLQLAFPLEQAVKAYYEVLEAYVNIERLEPFLLPSQPKAASYEPGSKDDAIAVQMIGLGYSRNTVAILRDINLGLPRNKITAVVGPSGAGKSTLAHIAVGLVTPTVGLVRHHFLNGKGDVVAYVPQTVPLFNESLLFNVDLGRGFSRTEVEEVLSLCQMSGFMANLEFGLDTKVGDGGVRLSGGERQRLGFARALITNPSLIVLDEVTANLDSETSAAVKEQIFLLRGKATCLIVTHDTSLAQLADQIVFMESGQIGYVGTHEELLDRSLGYKLLVTHANEE